MSGGVLLPMFLSPTGTPDLRSRCSGLTRSSVIFFYLASFMEISMALLSCASSSWGLVGFWVREGYGGVGGGLLLETEDLFDDTLLVTVDVGVGDFDKGLVETELFVGFDDLFECFFGHEKYLNNVCIRYKLISILCVERVLQCR